MSSSDEVHANTLTQAMQLSSNELDVAQKTRSLKKGQKLGHDIEEGPSKETEEEKRGKPRLPLSRIGSFKRRNAHLAPLHVNASKTAPRAVLPIVSCYQPLSLEQGTTLSSSSDSPSRPPPAKSTASSKSVDIGEQSVMSSKSFAYPAPDVGPLQRIRMAKLSRNLAENIPQESVLRPRDDIASFPSSDKQKRRKSLDLSLTPLHSPVKPSLENKEGARLKRSRSLWARKGHTDTSETAADFQRRYDRNFGLQRAMSERQRMLNVKRARKMAQVFGQEPPQELIHIINEDERLPTLKQGNRDSIHSFSSNPVSPTSPTSIHVPTLPFATSNLSDPPALKTDVESTASERERRPSLPPFVSAIAPNPRLVSQISQLQPIPDTVATFGERRRRAAKLSRFFGVKYQDLSSHTPPPTQDFKPQVPQKPSVVQDVDVQVIGRSRFWGDRVKTRDADVISHLRELKAS